MLIFKREKFLNKLFSNSDKKIDFSEFENLLINSNQKFFNDDNEFGQSFGKNENIIYISGGNNSNNQSLVRKNLKNSMVEFFKSRNSLISSLLYHKPLKILIFTNNNGLCFIYDSNNRKHIKTIGDKKAVFETIFIRNNSILMASTSIVYIYKIGKNRSNINISKKIVLSKKMVFFKSIIEVKKNVFWFFGSNSCEIYKLEFKNQQIKN